jgi:hypothetical protein
MTRIHWPAAWSALRPHLRARCRTERAADHRLFRPNLWYEYLGNPKTEFSSADGFIPFRADLGGPWLELKKTSDGFVRDPARAS